MAKKVVEPEEKLYRTREVAEILEVRTATVTRWIHEKRIKGIRTPGGQWRVPESDLREYIERYVTKDHSSIATGA